MTDSAPLPDQPPELAGWLRLMQTPGVGAETARRLLAAFGLPEAIFSASLPQLQAVVSDRIARELLQPVSSENQARIAHTLEWMAQPGNHVLTLADGAYPPALLTIPDPPIVLYIKGRIELLNAASIAVVGSRNASTQGIVNAGRFSEALAQAGLTVVSGLALGIDTAAHEGSLRHVGGSTVAVIGTGADIALSALGPTSSTRRATDCWPTALPTKAASSANIRLARLPLRPTFRVAIASSPAWRVACW